MTEEKPTVVLVHGAFAESASWNPVIEQLHAHGVRTVAVANPLRSVTIDAAYLRDVIAGIGTPVVLVGHSYGGMVISEAATDNALVGALVFVAAFAPDHGESALQLSGQFPGSTLSDAVVAHPVSSGGDELAIDQGLFHHQFAADVPSPQAALMAATQRPVTIAALSEGLPAPMPAWKSLPSWFVFGEEDRNLPKALEHYMAERAHAHRKIEIPGASHAVSVAHPGTTAGVILEAAAVPAAA